MKTLLICLLPVTLLAAGSVDHLAKEVRHELVMLPYYGVFDDLSYRIDGSTVTLFGAVTHPRLKDDAGASVKGIEGVTRVDNQIEVLPLSPDDDRIRRAAYNSIYSKSSLQRYQLSAVPPIHIIVRNGSITLVGVVDSEIDKDIAGIAANGVPGSFKVENQLQIAQK